MKDCEDTVLLGYVESDGGKTISFGARVMADNPKAIDGFFSVFPEMARALLQSRTLCSATSQSARPACQKSDACERKQDA